MSEYVFDPNTGLLAPDWFTQDPKHAAFILARVTDVDVAVNLCRKTAVAVQAGGYLGLWPLRLAKHFSVVHTFEPLASNFACLQKNVEKVPGIIAYQSPLSKVDGEPVKFVVRKGWGSGIYGFARQEEDTTGCETHTARSIDSLQLPACDLIYLDIEGAELAALEGAKATIAKFKPVIALEVWEENRAKYRHHMNLLGYTMAKKSHADEFYTSR